MRKTFGFPASAGQFVLSNIFIMSFSIETLNEENGRFIQMLSCKCGAVNWKADYLKSYYHQKDLIKVSFNNEVVKPSSQIE